MRSTKLTFIYNNFNFSDVALQNKEMKQMIEIKFNGNRDFSLVLKIIRTTIALGISLLGCIWAIRALVYPNYSLSPNMLTLVASVCMLAAANIIMGDN